MFNKMIKNYFSIVTFILFVFFISSAMADEAEETNSNRHELSAEELKKRIGRYGEIEEIPEGFEFSEAENKLWRSDHLKNIDQPVRLYYEFIKAGTYEDGFTDSVYLDIVEINEDGTKNALLEFFTAERTQNFGQDNVSNIIGNPVLAIYMQGDIFEMQRLTSGHWRHFQKMLKIALRNATVEPIDFEFNGKQHQGDKISFHPYQKDPHRSDFEKFSDKRYEFIFSEEIPGTLFQIRTIIPSKKESASEPLIEETLTLVEAHYSN